MSSASDALAFGRRALAWCGTALLDGVLPPQCVTCEQPVAAPGQFCGACFARTSFITAPCCERCGTPFASAGARVCEPCLDAPPDWGEARAALRYDDQARRLLLPFKYADRTELARALAPLMTRAGAALLARADLVVPVPLHRWRMLSRRYNQAALLARAVARLSGRPAVLDALRRVRRTAPLNTLSPERRRAALGGAFMVAPHRRAMLIDARVLLIDDVLTSGATAGACTRVLLAAGAGGVDVLAAARTVSSHPG